MMRRILNDQIMPSSIFLSAPLVVLVFKILTDFPPLLREQHDVV